METGRLLVKPKLAKLTRCTLEKGLIGARWRMHSLTHTPALSLNSCLVLLH